MPNPDNRVEVPPSQKTSPEQKNIQAEQAKTAPANLANQPAKATESGVVKNASGNVASASAPTVTGTQPKPSLTGAPSESALGLTPASDKTKAAPSAPPPPPPSTGASTAVAPAAKEEAAKKEQEAADNVPLENTFSDLKGEVLLGDSFRITAKRGDVTIQIPVGLQDTRDVYVLDNTFKLLNEMLRANRKDLREKFASFVGK